MKRKTAKLQILRRAIQVVSFLLLPGLFIDAFNGLKAITLAVVGGSVNFTILLPQIFPTVLLILATIILGRFFCGYICAFGTLGDAFHILGSKGYRIKFKMNETADKLLKYFKYVLLLLLGLTWILGISLFAKWSPWDAFGILDSMPPDFSYAFANFTVGSLILIFMMIGSMFIERFFCRYFCPLGAVFSIASRLRIGKIKKPNNKCGKCKVCTSNCIMGIPLYNNDVVSSGECVNCMKCVAPCPRKNVRFTVASQDVASLVASFAAVSLIGLYYGGNISINAFEASNVKTEQIVSINSEVGNVPTITESAQQATKNVSVYIDGTYEGNGIGFRNRTTTVSVIILKGQITDIQTISTGDDMQFYNGAFSQVPSEIISNQSSSVNGVSGATFSSIGIMSAVTDALSKARG